MNIAAYNKPVRNYLEGLDRALNPMPSSQRIAALKRERQRVDFLRAGLERWALKGGDEPPPSRFNAFDIELIEGELLIRLTNLEHPA
jgi:hypothetical protein